MAWPRLLLICLTLTLLSACGEAPPESIRFGIKSMPLTLDPRYATDAASARINRLLYAQLVDFDESSRPQASLARWRRLSPTHYRFYLTDRDRRFTNGDYLTAKDVKATYESVLDPGMASPHRGGLKLISRIELIDSETLDFYLSRPDPLFPGYLVIGILPEQAIYQGRRLDREPVGSGPFAFENWPAAGRLSLVRRSDGQRISFIQVSDSTVRVLKLLRNEIDLIQNDLPRELVHYLEDQRDVRILHKAGTNYSYIAMNLRDPDLSDIRVRQALALSIDADLIVRRLFGGETRRASTLLAPEHWASLELTPYRYDPARAVSLLREAGFDTHHPLKLVYKTSNDPFRLRLATVLQHQWSQVGIEVELRSYDWATVYSDIREGRFQLASLSWVGIKTPDIFRYVFHSESLPPAGANRGAYRNARVDEWIEQAEQTTSLQRQAEFYQQIQKQVLADLPYIPLWYEEHFAAMGERIRGYRLAADGNYDGLLYVTQRQAPVRLSGH